MATTFPSAKQTFTDPSGTSLIATGPDHATLHTTINDTVEAMQDAYGTTAGTNILKDFSAGQFPIRHTGGTIQHLLVGGTINSLLGTLPTFVNPTLIGGTASALLLGTSTVQGGTVANAALGTPTLMGGTIAVSGTVTPVQPGAALAPPVVTLTDSAGGTIALNAQAAQVFHLILGTTAGNRTFAAPTNPTEGQALIFRVKQNTNNTGTIVFNAVYRFAAGGTPSLGTQSTYNYMSFRYNSVDTKWDHQGDSLGLI